MYRVAQLFFAELSVPHPSTGSFAPESIHRIVKTAFVVKRSASFRRAVLGYALWLVRNRRNCADAAAFIGAGVCRTVDELREVFHVPNRVIAHLRRELAAQGFGELQSPATTTIERLIHTRGHSPRRS